jgi:hypothetical protein
VLYDSNSNPMELFFVNKIEGREFEQSALFLF